MATNNSSLSADLAQLGGQARAAGQRIGLIAEDPVPGDPQAAAAAAEQLTQLGQGCTEVGDALARIDTGDWRGPAADAFRSNYAHHTPDQLRTGGDAFTRSGTAMRHYAEVLSAQKPRGQQAVEQMQAAQAATEQARQAHNAQVAAANTPPAGATPGPPPAFTDPGASAHAAAQQELDAARAAVQQAGDEAAHTMQQTPAPLPASQGSSFGAAAGEAASTLGQAAAGAGDLIGSVLKATGGATVAAAAAVDPAIGLAAPQVVQPAQDATASVATSAARAVGQAGFAAAGGLQSGGLSGALLRWTDPAAARQVDRQVSAAATQVWHSAKTGADVDQWHHNTGRAGGAAIAGAAAGGVAGGAVAKSVTLTRGGELADGAQAAHRAEQATHPPTLPDSSVHSPTPWGQMPEHSDVAHPPAVGGEPATAAQPDPVPHTPEPAGPADHGMPDGLANSDHPAPPPSPQHGMPEPPPPAGEPPPHAARPEARPLPPGFTQESFERLESNIREGRANWWDAFRRGDDPAMASIDKQIARMEFQRTRGW